MIINIVLDRMKEYKPGFGLKKPGKSMGKDNHISDVK